VVQSLTLDTVTFGYSIRAIAIGHERSRFFSVAPNSGEEQSQDILHPDRMKDVTFEEH
jgi:hypothetical protein